MHLADHNIMVAVVFGVGVLLRARGNIEDSFPIAMSGIVVMGAAILYGIFSGFGGV